MQLKKLDDELGKSVMEQKWEAPINAAILDDFKSPELLQEEAKYQGLGAESSFPMLSDLLGPAITETKAKKVRKMSNKAKLPEEFEDVDKVEVEVKVTALPSASILDDEKINSLA